MKDQYYSTEYKRVEDMTPEEIEEEKIALLKYWADQDEHYLNGARDAAKNAVEAVRRWEIKSRASKARYLQYLKRTVG